METHIETWGILGRFIPSESRDLIWHSLHRGRKYYNQLVESERSKRAEYRSERTRLAPQIAPQLVELEDLEHLTKEQKALLRALRSQVKECDELALASNILEARV